MWTLGGFLCTLVCLASCAAPQCPHPETSLYSTITLSSKNRQPSSTATYNCDEGYELFGNPLRTCSESGKWTGQSPHCAVNVAYGKPANQSSTVRGGDANHANDGDTTTIHENKFCTETKSENSPWWQVDLLHIYAVRVVRIVTRGCCGHQPLHDLEIRVGNSSAVQSNRLCAWYPGTLDDGIIKDFECAYPIIGRYVFIQMVGIQGSLTMCEVMVFTTEEISVGRCGNQMEPLELTTFSRTCYEFQIKKGGSFQEAEEYCKARGGLMAHTEQDLTHNFIASELDRRKELLKSKLVWLGAKRDSGLRSKTWHWVNKQPVTRYLWADDQPNNYNGQQNCVVLDGGRKWLWNDVTCDLDYLPWVCQYNPSNCGSPDRKENSTVLEKDYRIGQLITYLCPEGHVVFGNTTRKCGSNGFWTETAPSCKYVDCGPLPDINNGKVVLSELRSTYNATAKYKCIKNYTLVGNDTRICRDDGKWNGSEPVCFFNICPELKTPQNGSLELSGLTSGSIAVYMCGKGHKLVGNNTRVCQLGGNWTGEEPICKFLDCGIPPKVEQGGFQLIDGTTTYRSRVSYYCFDNYTLSAKSESFCEDTGLWSERKPSCQLINCGKPDVPNGAYIDNSTYTVHSKVQYHCSPGHKMSGDDHRICDRNGRWSVKAPFCKYIDCGRVQPILKGEIKYSNGTTHLNSIVTYICSSGYRLVGPRLRHCLEDGKWSSGSAKCEEIRCIPPEVPKNATVVFGGNDRASADSFKIGSTVQYRCIAGHLVKGEPLRTCLPTGVWSQEPPLCLYTDCGLPFPVPHGHWLLPNNSTFYGSQVEYQCDVNFELDGAQRRLCLENGTWSNSEPSCKVISCGEPKKKDNQTLVEGSSYTVESTINYSCLEGYKVQGNATRICTQDGKWSGQTPYCILVDCGTPGAIANGQGFLANGTTTYQSVVQYRCLPDFQMIGEPIRICLASGEWSNQEPRCTDIIPDSENAADGRLSDNLNGESDASRIIGIAIAVGAGALLIVIIITAVICMKMRKAKNFKQSSSLPANHSNNKDTASIRSYPRLAFESDVNGSGNINGGNAVRNNPNGLVTFSSNPQPIYANITVNGQSVVSNNENSATQRHLRNRVIQSESL